MLPPRRNPCPESKRGAVDDAVRRFQGKGYKQMQRYVKARYAFEPKTCWIADRKEQLGFQPKRAWNRGK
jgi:hypothetical protein